MRILLTGSTSAQTREVDRDKNTTTAGRIAAELRRHGAVVTVAPQNPQDPAFDTRDVAYDFAIVGLAPLRGVSSSYAYGALNTISRFGDRVWTYAQDLDDRRVENDLQSISRAPAKMVDPFFCYKRGWQAARKPEIFPQLVRTVRMLADEGRRPRTLDLSNLDDLRVLVNSGKCVTVR